MNISRFVGATSREALRQVRLALGPDALIISNKRVNGGVEILASDQTAMPEEVPVAAPEAPPEALRRPPASVARPPGAAAADVLGAIGELKGTLESRIDELVWGNQLRQSPQAISVFQTLLQFGFSTALLRAMLKRMPTQPDARAALQWARRELIDHLPVMPSEEALWQPGLVLALVGPTGIGKTTTLAKLAARCVRRMGADHLVLLTTDTYRIGAHEQLKIYGQMLHVPVHVVQDAPELRRILQSVRADQVVLIDNVGTSQRDRYVADQAALLAGAGRRVERLLVLNAASQGDTLDEVARTYLHDGGTPLKGCIITKVDEASRHGAVLDTALRYQLPIHYVSDGQKVPENLRVMSAAELIDLALVPLEGHRTLYSPTEADLAALLSVTPTQDEAQRAADRLQQNLLLPQLLTRSADGGDLTQNQLNAAVACLDADALLSASHDMWQSRQAGRLPAASQLIEQGHRSTSGLSAQPGWILHDRWSVVLDGRRGVWSAAFYCGTRGRPVAAGAQQLELPDGRYATSPASTQGSVLVDPRFSQVEAASQVWPSSCQVLAQAGQTVMRALDAGGYSWLALCPPRTVVHQPDGASLASAVARGLSHRPLGLAVTADGGVPAGISVGRVSLWAAAAAVQLRSRGLQPLETCLYSLRAVDAETGGVLRSWYALGSGVAQIEAEHAAEGILAHHALSAQRRMFAALLADDRGPEPLLDRLAYCAQMGLAAGHLARSGQLLPASQVAARLVGTRTLTLRTAPHGLLKLFSLKALLAVGS
ncbi:MAG TPA: flagellar biosynthesis protein FlhF [Castellaniella sp.]|uniref:flagellar biosynthesis protein FlhF n=1 Tax=Castellaniella sp. TaxID=1955812 RepID=UPI002F0B46AB